MLTSLDDIKRHLQPGFTQQQTDLLATCIYESYEPLVTKREMTELRHGVQELVDVQKRMEVRMERLTASQEQTDVRLDRLTASQERTEVRLERLTASHEEIRDEIKDLVQVTKTLVWGQNDLRKQVGGIADSVGQGLEAYAMERIPRILEQQFEFVLESAAPETIGPVGNESEIDVVCRGTFDGRPAAVLCEVKTNITETEVREFLATADRVRPAAGVDDVRILFFGYRSGEAAQRLIAEYGCWLAFPRGLVVS
ncbi:MAG: hypothetical protein WCH77_06130 [Planctomycetota bacterium]